MALACFAFPASLRLRRPAEFVRLLDRSGSVQGRSRKFLALSMRVARLGETGAATPSAQGDAAASHSSPAGATVVPAVPGVRLGITVGKRNARHAVQRNLVKRVLRESFRHLAPDFSRALSLSNSQVDLVLRLKAGFPPPAETSLAEFKAMLRSEVEDLLAWALRRLPVPDGGQ